MKKLEKIRQAYTVGAAITTIPLNNIIAENLKAESPDNVVLRMLCADACVSGHATLYDKIISKVPYEKLYADTSVVIDDDVITQLRDNDEVLLADYFAHDHRWESVEPRLRNMSPDCQRHWLDQKINEFESDNIPGDLQFLKDTYAPDYLA